MPDPANSGQAGLSAPPAAPASPAPPGPVAARIVLGARLRQLREAAAVGPQPAALAIRGSHSKISRIELGRHAARETDVVDLLDRYQVSDQAERDHLLGLASRALAVPWWQRFADLLPPWYSMYLGLEEAAASIVSYDLHFVPGLLQTADYATELALLRDFDPPVSSWLRDREPIDLTDPVTLDRFGELHAQRLVRFAAGAGRMCCVIDEAALRRSASTPQRRRAQLSYLLEAASNPRVTVRIRPLTAGPPVAPVGFSLLRFSDALLADVVYVDHLTGASYLDRPADVTRYAAKLDRMGRSSPPAEQTPAIIERMLRRPAGRLAS
jgi:Domain of unknown function (DUF5753)/Helix-turn-helix domain